MTERVAPLSLSILTVAAWALSLAIFAARPELFVVALPLLVTLAALGRRPSMPDYALTHTISADRVYEGDRVMVTVAVTARSPIPLMELVEPLSPVSSLVPARHRSVLGLRAGETAQWSHEVRCTARGRFDLGPCFVRTWDGLGLRAWEQSHNQSYPVRVYPRLLPLRTLPRPLRTQTSIGDHVSREFGEGIEPGDIREFAPGDRIKQVNWRASLRLGRLYVTQHHRERNADIVLMLDTLAEVGRAPATSLDLTVRAVASLAAAYLARKDRVGLINYGGLIHWVRPGSGRVQYERLADALLGAAVIFTYVAKDLALVPPRVLPPHALVIAVTSLLDRRFARAIIDLAGRGFDLVTLVVSPVDVTRAALPASPRTDLACRLWALERRGQIDDLRRRGLLVLEWHPSQPLELALAAAGRRRPRVVATG